MYRRAGNIARAVYTPAPLRDPNLLGWLGGCLLCADGNRLCRFSVRRNRATPPVTEADMLAVQQMPTGNTFVEQQGDCYRSPHAQ